MSALLKLYNYFSVLLSYFILISEFFSLDSKLWADSVSSSLIVLQTGMGLSDKLFDIVLILDTVGTGFSIELVLLELYIVFWLDYCPIVALDGNFNDYQLKKLLGVNKFIVLQE